MTPGYTVEQIVAAGLANGLTREQVLQSIEQDIARGLVERRPDGTIARTPAGELMSQRMQPSNDR